MLTQIKFPQINNRHDFKHKMKIIICLSLLIGFFIPINLFAQQPNLYRNKEHAFRIIFPVGWYLKPVFGPNMVVKAVNRDGDSISVLVRKLPPESKYLSFDQISDADLYEYIKVIFNEFKQAFPDAILNKYGVTYLSNKKAIWYSTTYSMKHVTGTFTISALQVMTINRNKVFIVGAGCSPEKYNYFYNTFLATISSFIFEAPSWY